MIQVSWKIFPIIFIFMILLVLISGSIDTTDTKPDILVI